LIHDYDSDLMALGVEHKGRGGWWRIKKFVTGVERLVVVLAVS
jgi:hypothetical protein